MIMSSSTNKISLELSNRLGIPSFKILEEAIHKTNSVFYETCPICGSIINMYVDKMPTHIFAGEEIYSGNSSCSCTSMIAHIPGCYSREYVLSQLCTATKAWVDRINKLKKVECTEAENEFLDEIRYDFIQKVLKETDDEH